MSEPAPVQTAVVTVNTPQERRLAARIIVQRLGDGDDARRVMEQLFGPPRKRRI